MREPPAGLDDAAVLACVREHWQPDATDVEHLPVGFGAHHWRVSVGYRPTHFATYDTYGRHTPASLEAAYAGAGALAFALDFVVAGLPHEGLGYTVPLHEGSLSCTPWVVGEPAGTGAAMTRAEAEVTARMIGRLHQVAPPRGMPVWAPLAPPGLADDLGALVAEVWDTGPFGEEARSALRRRLPEVTRWTTDYHRLAERAGDRPWVATHGEPHLGNQLATPHRTLLVDWESLKLGPRERDLRTLVEAGHPDLAEAAGADPALLAMFDLEWRLDEIEQYAAWFARPHLGTASDAVALEGLLEALDRPG